MLQTELSSGPEDKIVLELRLPRDTEQTAEAMAGVFAALTNLKSSLINRLLGKEKPLIFEIAVDNQIIHFYAVVPLDYQSYFESQLSAQYPTSTILASPDYLSEWGGKNFTVCGQLRLASYSYLPLKTYTDFKETDPLSSILGMMARAEKEEKILMQLLILPAGRGWQHSGASVIHKGIVSLDGKVSAHPQATLIEQKIGLAGFRCAIRLLVCSPNKANILY